MYSIGEFSKLTGVAAGTLRYYEQYNIVSPLGIILLTISKKLRIDS